MQNSVDTSKGKNINSLPFGYDDSNNNSISVAKGVINVHSSLSDSAYKDFVSFAKYRISVSIGSNRLASISAEDIVQEAMLKNYKTFRKKNPKSYSSTIWAEVLSEANAPLLMLAIKSMVINYARKYSGELTLHNKEGFDTVEDYSEQTSTTTYNEASDTIEYLQNNLKYEKVQKQTSLSKETWQKVLDICSSLMQGHTMCSLNKADIILIHNKEVKNALKFALEVQ